MTDATIDCCNKHVTPSMLFSCHYSPDKTAFTFLQCSLQSLSHATLAPVFFSSCLCNCSSSSCTVSYTLYFPCPVMTPSGFPFLPSYIPFIFSEQEAWLVERRVDMDRVRPQCHFLIKKYPHYSF